MDRVACWTSPGDVHGLLGNAVLEHVDMLVDKGSSIYSTMNMKSGIDNALLSAADPLLQSLMKLDDRGGFFRQADMEQGLLFAIRARGSEERWRAQGHDIAEVSYKLRVMLSHLRQKKGFKATANTCKKSVERASRPHPFIAFRNNAAEDDVSEEFVPICCRIWDGERGVAWDENGDCFPADTYREDGAFATAVWHREDIPDLPLEVPATWIVGETIQKPGARFVINTSRLFIPSRLTAQDQLLLYAGICITFHQNSLEFACEFSNRCHVSRPTRPFSVQVFLQGAQV